ncbi:hypothetical protein [Phaeodactylibacter luteus]|uniref:Uncharacterized protein n=1 Tax=Phaeodactylibacter luteus TaxID=1564516 RepID=A0A5C6S300_9BACT|nr:hypothetical protein [Phaeodactylibacter luteus]TXB68825.1 hypothetical protein FRY97_01820 [Phaeodactylibacter luteus]
MYRIGIISWALFCSFAIALFGAAEGQTAYAHTSAASFSVGEDVHLAKLLSPAAASSADWFADLEVKEEVDEEEGGLIGFQPALWPSAAQCLSSVAALPNPPQAKKVKLFILFHSWKSFLHGIIA